MKTNLVVLDNSKNYTCQVIKLPVKHTVEGLDNLVKVTYQGNDCLISKDSNPDELYLFFPAECQIADWFLRDNNLYRHKEKNFDTTVGGFFEDNRRVKAVKFKGVISSGFVIPLRSLHSRFKVVEELPVLGDEFNTINGVEICCKYVNKTQKNRDASSPKSRIVDSIVDSKMAPEHMDTEHLLKNVHKFDLNTHISVTYKLHGTSARFFNTLVKRKLTWLEKIAKFFGAKVVEEDYEYVCASRRVTKSVGFEELPNKNHYFNSGDLWSEVGKEFFEGLLHKGEAVYCEIVGKTYSGEAIQKGYTYGYSLPNVFIYRISNINPQGIEVDLPFNQMVKRAEELGLPVCPIYFEGKVHEFVDLHTDREEFFEHDMEWWFNHIFYNQLLEKPSILDKSVVEEGFCIRIDNYPKPLIYKIKSKAFLIHEGHVLDKQETNLEDEESNSVHA
jgi:hypothetical protein